MKHLLSLSIALLLATVLRAQTAPVIPEHGPKVSFDKEVYDYGTIPQGADGRCAFLLTNVGDEPLVISNFQSSCGCLVPYFEKDPVMPGKSTMLRARYDTNRAGPFQKSLTLTTNAVDSPVLVLRIKGVVKPKAEEVRPSSATAPDH